MNEGYSAKPQLSSQEMIRQFEEGTLPAELFRHADHVKVAFYYLLEYPILQVLERFPAMLMRFAAALGKPGLYHETITWAFLLLIRERMASSQENPTWEQFAAANADLLNGKSSVLKKYYKAKTLNSALARRMFLLPDRIA
jgi:hypothetical protein